MDVGVDMCPVLKRCAAQHFLTFLQKWQQRHKLAAPWRFSTGFFIVICDLTTLHKVFFALSVLSLGGLLFLLGRASFLCATTSVALHYRQ